MKTLEILSPLARQLVPKREATRHTLLLALSLSLSAGAFATEGPDAVNIGSRRELFVDDYLIERISGEARLRLHQPVPREIAIIHDAPWEGSGSGYHSLFRDGDLYKMYYKAWPVELKDGKYNEAGGGSTCYAESTDGIHWEKPNLGIHEFQGSKANNIVITNEPMGKAFPDGGHPSVFKDENPKAPPDARYKAIVRSDHRDARPERGVPKGLLALKSADGLHWTLMSDAPVITDGQFDSQNLAFWDTDRGEYRAYWRYFFTKGSGIEQLKWSSTGVRGVRTAVSKDLLHWTDQRDLTYTDLPDEHLYTNQIKPYHRAPHILLGFPVRYIDRGWSDSMRALPEPAHREAVDKVVARYGTAITEGLLMASRDRVTFKKWKEAFLRPGVEREGTWNYGQQFIAWHVVETKSHLSGAPNELSIYASESYCTPPCLSSSLRRYTLRLDGFVSVSAPMSGGELLTKLIKFQGSSMTLNFSSAAAGDVRVEILDERGRPFPGFSLEDCAPVFGDAIERQVSWRHGSDLTGLVGKTVRLRFAMRDADVYAYQFKP